MDTENVLQFFDSTRLKTARRKKQLAKKDCEKQYIQISKRENLLWKTKHDLPLEPLETPYQQGWIRFFEVRNDVKQSKDFEFYNNLLNKINTHTYSNNKSFKKSKKRYGRRVQIDRIQLLKEVSIREFDCPKFGLTPKEKAKFSIKQKWNSYSKKTEYYYYFDESWRYVLKIKPQ